MRATCLQQAGDLSGPTRQPVFTAVGIAQDRPGPLDEQAAQIPVTPFGNPSQPLATATGMLSGHQSQIGRIVACLLQAIVHDAIALRVEKEST